jgi:hypothetical protein
MYGFTGVAGSGVFTITGAIGANRGTDYADTRQVALTFDSSLGVSTSAQNSPVTASVRIWRRISG